MKRKLRSLCSAILSAALAISCLTPSYPLAPTASADAYGVMPAAATKPTVTAKTSDDKYKSSENMFCIPPEVTVTSDVNLKSVEVNIMKYVGLERVPELVASVSKSSFDEASTTYTFTLPDTGTYAVTAVDENGGTTEYTLYVMHAMGGRATKYYAPTCTEDGYIDYVQICKQCGEEYYSNKSQSGLNKLEHKYNSAPDNPVATPCEEAKNSISEECTLNQYICTLCGEVKNEMTNGAAYDDSSHNWVESGCEFNQEPSGCAQPGFTYYVCSDCGAIKLKEKTNPPQNHSPKVTESVAATCTASAYDVYQCSVCETDLGRKNTGIALGHKYVPTDESVVLSCTQGYTGPVKCSRCNDTPEQEQTIPPLPHTYVLKRTEPTCQTEGRSFYACSVCGAEKPNSEKILEKLKHVPEPDDYDCSTPSICKNCHEVIPGGEAKEHSYTTWGAEPGTGMHIRRCMNEGCQHTETAPHEYANPEKACTSATRCTVCGSRRDPLGHISSEKLVVVSSQSTLSYAPEDPNGGYHAIICTRCKKVLDNKSFTVHTIANKEAITDCTIEAVCACGKVLREALTEHVFPEKPERGTSDSPYHEYDCINATCTQKKTEAHDYSFKSNELVGQDATCTTAGYYFTVGECKCGALDEPVRVEIPAKGHTFGDWENVTNQCTTYQRRICSDCGYEETQNFDYEAHTFGTEYTVDQEPTCISEGIKSIHCAICGAIKPDSQTVIPKTEHDKAEEVTVSAATCTDPGIKEYRCSYCHELRSAEAIPATGHSMSAWECAQTASCEEAGTQISVCAVCGYKDVRTCPDHPATGHDWTEYISDNNASYGKNCTETRTCVNCGLSETREIPDTAFHEHFWGAYVYQNDATCFADGTEIAYCEKCGTASEPRTVEGTKLEHLFMNYLPDNNATCTEDGTLTALCEYCGIEKDTIPDEGTAKGHVFLNYVPLGDATCTSDGREEALCENGCGYADVRISVGSKLDHVFAVYTSDGNATCTEDGTETAYCVYDCGAKDTRTAVGSAGHDYGSPTFTWNADHTAATAEFVCQRDSSHVEKLQAEVGETVVEPDCETAGNRIVSAKVTLNGTTHVDAIELETYAALGHSYGEPVFTWSADGLTATAERVCKNDPSHKEELKVTITSKTVKAPTCVEEGATLYTATCEADGVKYTSENEVAEPATPNAGHSYGEPVFTWSADGLTATAERVCKNEPSHKEELKVTITSKTVKAPTCVEEGATLYTATCEADGVKYTSENEVVEPITTHTYSSGYCVYCGVKDPNYVDHSHTVGASYNHDARTHWKLCSTCLTRFDVGQHEFENGVCTVCGYSVSSGIDNGGIIVNDMTAKEEVFTEVEEVSGDVFGVYHISLGKSGYKEGDLVTVRVYAPGAKSGCKVIVRDDWELLKGANVKIDGDYVEFTVDAGMIKKWEYFAVVSDFVSPVDVPVPVEAAVTFDAVCSVR